MGVLFLIIHWIFGSSHGNQPTGWLPPWKSGISRGVDQARGNNRLPGIMTLGYIAASGRQVRAEASWQAGPGSHGFIH